MDKSPPVPQPRRHVIANDDPPKSAYENVTIDLINKNIDINDDNLQSNRKSKIQHSKSFILPTASAIITSPPVTSSTITNQPREDVCKNTLSEMNNLNTDKNKNFPMKSIPETSKINNLNELTTRPIPAPRRVCKVDSNVEQEIYTNSGNENAELPSNVSVVVLPTTGAVSKMPNITRRAPETPPMTAKVSPLRKCDSTEILNDFYVPPLEKSRSNTSVNSSASGHSAKYSNPSPG